MGDKPKVAFDKAALIQHLNQMRDRETIEQDEVIAALKDKTRFDKAMTEWRAECAAMVTALAEKVADSSVGDSDYSRFELPYLPQKPQSWEVRDAENKKKRIIRKYQNIIGAIQATKGDEFTYADLRTMGLIDLVKMGD